MPTTVLLVEPHFESRDIFATAMRHAGYHVLEATSGEEALRLALASPPHLVVCTFPVPIYGGDDLARALRRDPRFGRVPILAITTRVFPEEVDQAIASGIDQVLPKPVALARFLEAVRQMAGPPIA